MLLMFIYPRISKDVESLLALAGWEMFSSQEFSLEGVGTGRRLKGKTLSVRNMTDELCEISSARPGSKMVTDGAQNKVFVRAAGLNK